MAVIFTVSAMAQTHAKKGYYAFLKGKKRLISSLTALI